MLKNLKLFNKTAGITKNPNIDTVRAIARALECTLDDFDDTPNLHSVSLSERDHIKKYRALDEHGQKNVDLILDSEYERCTAKEPIVLHDVKSSPEVPTGFRAISMQDVETRAAHVPPGNPQPTEEQQKKLASLADKVRKKHEGK